ncbi:unnamed protein product, partial [Protopolystoma xenopodis]
MNFICDHLPQVWSTNSDRLCSNWPQTGPTRASPSACCSSLGSPETENLYTFWTPAGPSSPSSVSSSAPPGPEVAIVSASLAPVELSVGSCRSEYSPADPSSWYIRDQTDRSAYGSLPLQTSSPSRQAFSVSPSVSHLSPSHSFSTPYTSTHLPSSPSAKPYPPLQFPLPHLTQTLPAQQPTAASQTKQPSPHTLLQPPQTSLNLESSLRLHQLQYQSNQSFLSGFVHLEEPHFPSAQFPDASSPSNGWEEPPHLSESLGRLPPHHVMPTTSEGLIHTASCITSCSFSQPETYLTPPDPITSSPQNLSSIKPIHDAFVDEISLSYSSREAARTRHMQALLATSSTSSSTSMSSYSSSSSTSSSSSSSPCPVTPISLESSTNSKPLQSRQLPCSGTSDSLSDSGSYTFAQMDVSYNLYPPVMLNLEATGAQLEARTHLEISTYPHNEHNGNPYMHQKQASFSGSPIWIKGQSTSGVCIADAEDKAFLPSEHQTEIARLSGHQLSLDGEVGVGKDHEGLHKRLEFVGEEEDD